MTAPRIWNPEERAEIQRQLSEESRRRRDFPTRFLRILVDGRERVRIDPRASSVARLSLEDAAEMIEVRATVPDGEILLAVHALTGAPDGEETGSQDFSIVLESGQSLSFRVDGSAGLDGERTRTVELAYRETGPLRAALLGARRAVYRAGEAARFAAGWAQQPITLLLLLRAIALALNSAGHRPTAPRLDRASRRPFPPESNRAPEFRFLSRPRVLREPPTPPRRRRPRQGSRAPPPGGRRSRIPAAPKILTSGVFRERPRRGPRRSSQRNGRLCSKENGSRPPAPALAIS